MQSTEQKTDKPIQKHDTKSVLTRTNFFAYLLSVSQTPSLRPLHREWDHIRRDSNKVSIH